MQDHKPSKKKTKGQDIPEEKSLEAIIEHRKSVADAYKKILQSLESKIRNNEKQS